MWEVQACWENALRSEKKSYILHPTSPEIAVLPPENYQKRKNKTIDYKQVNGEGTRSDFKSP